MGTQRLPLLGVGVVVGTGIGTGAGGGTGEGEGAELDVLQNGEGHGFCELHHSTYSAWLHQEYASQLPMGSHVTLEGGGGLGLGTGTGEGLGMGAGEGVCPSSPPYPE